MRPLALFALLLACAVCGVMCDCVATSSHTCTSVDLPKETPIMASVQPNEHVYFRMPWTETDYDTKPQGVDAICVFVQMCPVWPTQTPFVAHKASHQPIAADFKDLQPALAYQNGSFHCRENNKKNIVCSFDRPVNTTSRPIGVAGTVFNTSGRIPWDAKTKQYLALQGNPHAKHSARVKVWAEHALPDPCASAMAPVACSSHDPTQNPRNFVCSTKSVVEEDLCGPMIRSSYHWSDYVLSVEPDKHFDPKDFDFNDFAKSITTYLKMDGPLVEISAWEKVHGDNLLKVAFKLGGLSKKQADSYLAPLRRSSHHTRFGGFNFVDARRGVLKENHYTAALVIVLILIASAMLVGSIVAALLHIRRRRKAASEYHPIE
eukprot:gnl/Trimastix_PCT/995.p1 GENE.gnl/Trimastix_PCT/995~~gnl/Trimastix_PCT/995.p1  ORF type:complete len:376 (+),score=82.95 gnl/Trimastix_PCT/995:39-1166(+)